MIPRLSGRAWQGRAASKSLPQAERPPMPSRHEADRVIRQFFLLIERFELLDAAHAPEVKASLRKSDLRRKAKVATRQRLKPTAQIEPGKAQS